MKNIKKKLILLGLTIFSLVSVANTSSDTTPVTKKEFEQFQKRLLGENKSGVAGSNGGLIGQVGKEIEETNSKITTEITKTKQELKNLAEGKYTQKQEFEKLQKKINGTNGNDGLENKVNTLNEMINGNGTDDNQGLAEELKEEIAENKEEIEEQIDELEKSTKEETKKITQNIEEYKLKNKQERATAVKATNNKINKIKNKIKNHNQKLKDLNYRTQTNEQDILDNTADIEDNANNIAYNSNKIFENKEKLKKHTKKLTEHNQKLNDHEERIAINEDDIEANKDKLQKHSNKLKKHDELLDQYNQDIQDNFDKISENKDNIKENKIKIQKLSEELLNAEYTIGEHSEKLAEHDIRLTNVENKANIAINGVSAAIAMANLSQAGANSTYSNNLSASYGFFAGSHSIALGLSGITSNDRITYKISTAFNTKGNIAFGLGLGINFGAKRENKSEIIAKQAEKIKDLTERLEKLEKLLVK